MRIRRPITRPAWLAILAMTLGLLAGTAWADVDPPDRVARVSYLRGNVSFQAAGDDQWVQMSLNRPAITGDRVYTDRDSRTELEVGAATMRLDERTTASLLNIDDDIAQIELSEGTLNLHVRRVFQGQSYEIDTPTLAFVVRDAGDYRIDIAPDGGSTMVTVFNGSGDVYGENNASYSVRSGNSYKFHDSALNDYEVFDLPRRDDFDQWCSTRNDRYERSPSRQYVSEEVIGYADLDDYGSWSSEPTYGSVWYPTRVEAGWTPYRYGSWSWVGPWGWTWVDNSPWGFAPSHYGRWVQVGSRWGWCPGEIRARPIYAPALVAFVGGNGWGVSVNSGPVGWFPLGPRDVYVPWYRTSRNYFTNVNVRNTTIINNTYITNVYNNYSRGGPITNVNYTYRNVNAVTAVPRNVFVGAGAVSGARVQVNEARLRNAQVVSRVGIMPERASFVGGARRGTAAPVAALDRRVIARSAPPAQSAPIASRLQAIRGNNAQPLNRAQLRELPAARGNAATPANRGNAAAGNDRGAIASRVRVVGQGSSATPRPLPMRNAASAPQRGATAPVTGNSATRGNNRVLPMPGKADDRGANTPNRGAGPGTDNPRTPIRRDNTSDRNTLPSSRFAPRAGARTGDGNAAPVTRGNANAPTRAATPANRSTTPANATRANVPVRGNSTNNADRSLPSSRFAPGNSSSNPRPTTTRNASSIRSTPQVERGTTPSPQRSTAPIQRSQSQAQSRSTPQAQPRSMPQVERRAPAPVQRSQPQYQQRSAPTPVQRSQPQYQQRSAPAPVQRSQPQYQQRSAPAPAQRSQPQYQQRSAPAPVQRSQPQYQQRSAPAPVQRSQPQQRSAPAPAQRSAPPQRSNNRGKKDNGDR